MPVHVHFFVRGNPDFVLASWVGGLNRAMSVALLNESQPTRPPLHRSTQMEESCRGSRAGCFSFDPSQATRPPLHRKSLWQPGFFDYVLRNDESYARKWEYVRDNPVCSGLVAEWGKLSYQGEVGPIERDECF